MKQGSVLMLWNRIFGGLANRTNQSSAWQCPERQLSAQPCDGFYLRLPQFLVESRNSNQALIGFSKSPRANDVQSGIDEDSVNSRMEFCMSLRACYDTLFNAKMPEPDQFNLLLCDSPLTPWFGDNLERESR